MLGTLIQGRISVSGASISATKVALTIAVRRALERRQFGAARRATGGAADGLPHAPAAAAARRWPRRTRCRSPSSGSSTSCTRCSRPTTDERDRRELETLAAGVKAVATWHATETIQSCREACGGAGYLRANRFAALKADTDVFTTFEGDNTILLQLAAKNLLTDYKDAFGELDPLGMAQFVAGQALGVLAERTPLRKLADGGDLLDARHPARPVPLAPRAPARGRGAAAQARDRRRPRPVLGADRLPGPRASRPPARGSIWSCSSRSRSEPAVRQAAQPVRAAHDRGRARLLPGARAAVREPLEGRRSRPSTSCAPSCARTCARSSTRSACPRPCSATRASSRSRWPA